MCRKDGARTHPILLLSEKACGVSPPPVSSTIATILILHIPFLVLMEFIGRFVMIQLQNSHELLDDETNRLILARHLFVDGFACFLCFILGWRNRKFTMGILDAFRGNNKSLLPESFESRALAYDGRSFYLCMFFFSYQVKNFHDSYVWNDGIEYLFHHCLSLCVAGMAMYPGYNLPYAEFYFGLSELSTAVVCILANFDDVHGVKGLGAAFPMTKVVIGAAFAVLFISARGIIWPIISYYYTRDAIAALKSDNKEIKKRSLVIKIFVFCLVGLSVLQIGWLGIIYFVAIEELKGVGLL